MAGMGTPGSCGCSGWTEGAQASASSLLHEAGHLAVLPGRFRHLASDDIEGVMALMCQEIDFADPDAGEARVALQCSDTEATAWAWAAGLAIGLPPHRTIQDGEYGGTGREIRFCLAAKAYLGINGLAATKLCALREGRLAEILGLPAYPKLVRWMQP
jgi:hypothetical protein